MTVKCQTVISLIEKFAPKSLAEEWDNVGLHVGDPSAEVKGVMVTLDINPQVITEAISLGVNLIISHHPLIFKSVKNVTYDNPQGKLLGDLIRNGINVYCAHTNLDSAQNGVNQVLAELLELEDVEVLQPDKVESLYKLVVFITEDHIDKVREAVTGTGAGWIGNYSDCTFGVTGTGTFKAREGAKPFLGEVGILEKASEIRLETIVKEKDINKVVKAMIKAHPYEEVAYDLYPLANSTDKLGLGRVGRLSQPEILGSVMDKVKKVLNVPFVRYGGKTDSPVKKVAVCGGSGAGLIHKAAFRGADVIVTGDLKYHDAQEALSLGLMFIDAGHFHTEFPIVAKLALYLERRLVLEGISVPVSVSRTNIDVFRVY